MARHRNLQWILPEGTPNAEGGCNHSWASLHAALLMDLRDELQKLNALLHCDNFIAIPQKLDAVVRNTAKRHKPKLRVVKRRAA